jgi:hypothetical protein
MTVNPTLATLYHAPAVYQPAGVSVAPVSDSSTAEGSQPAGRPGFDTAGENFNASRDPRFRLLLKPRAVVANGELLGAMITQMAGAAADGKGRHVDLYV